jgi:seryl-tRNA synthetase
MHDIRLIREDPAAFDAGLARRALEPLSSALIVCDERRRAAQTELQAALARRNEASKAIGIAKAQKREDEATALLSEVATLKELVPALEETAREADTALEAKLAVIPNLPADDVPEGADEQSNLELKRWGSPAEGEFAEHADLGLALGLDFEAAATIAGARFAVLKGGMARLNRAIGHFMLDRNTAQWGYTEVNPPLLVRDQAMYGTDKLPKFAEDSFQTTDGRWLIPTAEVSLTSLVLGQLLEERQLPLRFTALTPCFRSEAGSAGRDTKGLIRQHQFEKTELVSVVTPEASDEEHERMTRAAESILEALELPYRRMLLCTGDMGFGARKTFDLEVWLPGQGKYREISSCSNCGDFQGRRMNARFRREGGKPEFVHTLNGSALAVGRTLVAVLENYQDKDGSVRIPEALIPYMGGVTALTPA